MRKGNLLYLMIVSVAFGLALCVVPVQVEAETRVETGTGYDLDNRAQACADAKDSAVGVWTRGGDWRVTGYGLCDCSQGNDSEMWTCTVDATLTKDDD